MVEANRRTFLKQTALLAGSCAFCLNGGGLLASFPDGGTPALISPGCRKSKVRVAKVYLGVPQAHWPTPKMDLKEERQRYKAAFKRQEREFADVDFVVNELITQKAQLQQFAI